MLHIRRSTGEKVFDFFNVVFMCFIVIITLYPLLYVVSMSISDPIEVSKGTITFYPRGFNLSAYQAVFKSNSIFTGYANSIFYTGVGTAINITLTVLAAYPLTRRNFSLRKPLAIMIVIFMFFNGGLIPMYIIMNKYLHLYNTRWAILLPTAVDGFLVIMTRTFFDGIPESLHESAKIDGANDLVILWRIILPLSKPILAVLALFYAVLRWNEYFLSLIYLADKNLQPIQLFLYNMVNSNSNSFAAMMGIDASSLPQYGIQAKYALIVLVILPIICVYPFLQKYFVKGVMIGAVKE